MKNLMHTKIKYISITIGLLGLIPFAFPLIEKYGLVNFFDIKTIDFTIWYGIIILSFISGIYWGLSINALIKNNSDLNYLLPALSIIPFSFAIGTVIVSNYFSCDWLFILPNFRRNFIFI